MELGEKLKNARRERGLSQEQAAEALGVSRQTVSNWETGKTYPDILSAIRMSDLYAVSMDRLLKEETTVENSYAAYLKESEDTVKSHERLTKTVLIAAAAIIWAAGQAAVWLSHGAAGAQFGMLFRWGLLPLTAIAVSFAASRCGFWGRGKWWLVPIWAAAFLLVPWTTYTSGAGEAAFAFLWPSFRGLPIGAVSALIGLALGTALRKKTDIRAIKKPGSAAPWFKL